MSQLKTNYEIISDKAKNPVTTSEYIKHGDKWLDDSIDELKKDYVTPQMFGAVGDGETDDSEAFRKAIANIQYGGMLFIPKGDYLISAKCEWSGNDDLFPWWGSGKEKTFTIMGEGDGSRLITKNGSDCALEINYTRIEGKNRHKTINIKNISVDCNNKKYGLSFKACGFLNVENVTISNNKKANDADAYNTSFGIKIAGCGEFKINNIICEPINGCGIYLSEGSHDSIITNCSIVGGEVGICAENTGAVNIISNVIYGQSKASIKECGRSESHNGCFITNNQLECAGTGTCIEINTDTNDTNVSYGLLISENFIWVGGEHGGIKIRNAVNERIVNNLFATVGSPAGCKSITILSSNNGLYENNVWNGLRSSETAIDVQYAGGLRLIGNRVRDTASSSVFIHINNGENISLISNYYYSFTNGTFIKTEKEIAGLSLINNQNINGIISYIENPYDNIISAREVHNNLGFKIRDCKFDNNPLILGTYYIWVDADEKVRYKKGKPTNTLDGTILME